MTRRWYVPLIILLITAFVPWFQEMARIQKLGDDATVAKVPHYSVEKAREEYLWVTETEQKWSGIQQRAVLPENPVEFWRYVERRIMLRDALYKLANTSDHKQSWEFGSLLNKIEVGSTVIQVRQSFQEHFGDRLTATRPTDLYFDQLPDIETHLYEKFCFGYLWSIPIMFLIFLVKLRFRKLLIWPEIWRLIPASIFWPIGLVVYPRNLRREQQMKSAINFVAQFASAIIGLIGAGPLVPVMKAQIKKTGKNGVERTEKKRPHSFGYGIELYPQTAGIDKGMVAAPFYGHSHDLQHGFKLAGFGFLEVGERQSQIFTNHSISISHGKSYGAMFTAEVGGAKTGAFLQVGPRFNLTRLPLFPRGGEKLVKSVVAGSFWRIRGPTHYQEFFLQWASQQAKLPLGWRISSEGFMRFRPGPRPAIGQPQVILEHPRIPHTQLLTEFWMIGSRPTIRFGLQFSK